MSDPLEDRLSKAGEAVRELEKELDKFNSDNAIRQAVGTLIPARALEGQQLQNRLYEARQRQTSLLLESISESSRRLEEATGNLQQTSEAQVKISEAQVKIAQSQATTMEKQATTIGKLLHSSRTLERFTVWLLVVAAANIVVVVQTQLQPEIRIVAAVLVFVLLVLALVYSEASRQGRERRAR